MADNLGLQSIESIQWRGNRGATWNKLLQQVQYLSLYNSTPRAILIHLGSNNIATDKSICIRFQIKQDICWLLETFPHTVILFSAFLPRIKWSRTNTPYDALERKRKALNRFTRRFLEFRGHKFIRHDDIDVKTLGLYREDGVHMSDIGNDILNLDFKTALESLNL